MKRIEKINRWILVDEYNDDNIVIGRKWICPICKYIGLRWSLLVEKIRGGVPYEKPTYKYCPNCGEKLDNVW